VVWGPQAGYFATREDKPLTVAAVPASDRTAQPMRFEIAMGVRKNDKALAAELDAALAKLKPEIDALLDSYDVPRSPPAAQQKDARRCNRHLPCWALSAVSVSAQPWRKIRSPLRHNATLRRRKNNSESRKFLSLREAAHPAPRRRQTPRSMTAT